MSEVFTNRSGPGEPGKACGDPASSLSAPERQAAGKSDGARSDPCPQALDNRSAGFPDQLRIRIDVPMGTSYLEIQGSIFRQAWQLAGTQLRAAVALGITPDTISRVLKRCERLGLSCPVDQEPRPLVAFPESSAPLNRAAGPSAHRAGVEEAAPPNRGAEQDRGGKSPDHCPIDAACHVPKDEAGPERLLETRDTISDSKTSQDSGRKDRQSGPDSD